MSWQGRSLRAVLLALALAMAAALPARRTTLEGNGYKVIAKPSLSLSGFSGIDVGSFDFQDFIKSSETSWRFEGYQEQIPAANKAVRKEVEEAMSGFVLGGKGRRLTLEADLTMYKTGSSTGRAAMGMMSNRGRGSAMGNGLVMYDFFLLDGAKQIAGFQVWAVMKANRKGAYHALASMLRDSFDDQMDQEEDAGRK